MADYTEESISTQLARQEGKIDLLSQKLDAHRDLLLAKIEAGDRESGQAIALTNERVSNLGVKVAENGSRISVLESINADQATVLESLAPVKKVVYGLIFMCLAALMSGVLALVLRGSP